MKDKKILSNDEVEKLEALVKPYLTEQRYCHTIAVKKEAVKLGEIYLPDDVNRLAAAALLHDITKKADAKKQLQYCEEFGIIIEKGQNKAVLHALTGAKVAERDFPEYTDSEIVSGIRWHTTGRDGMTVFESIIFLADYIEETRTFDDCIAVRKYFYDGLNAGKEKNSLLRDTMIYAYDLTLTGLIKDGGVIDENTIAARNYFIIAGMQD